MLSFLDKISYGTLILFAVLFILAPFYPMPHAFEKIIMLKNGQLKRPLDIFDLVMHTAPLFVLIIKVVRDYIKAH